MRIGFRFHLLTAGLFAALCLGSTAGAQTVQQGIETLATSMGQRLVADGELTLAIVDFPSLRGDYCDLGRYVAERLGTQLAVTKGLKVAERALLDQALLEMKLGHADLADPEKAKQVGLRIGAEALMLGSLADLGPTVELNVRVLRLASGETVYAGTTTFVRSQGLEQLLRQGCGPGQPSARPPGAATATSTAAEASALPSYQNAQYRLTLESFKRVDSAVTAMVAVENLGKDPIKFAFRNTSYLIDENGDRWTQSETDSAALWAWGKDFALTDLVPGTRLRTRLQFKGAGAPTAQVFTLVAKEYRPQEGRLVSLSGIRAELAPPKNP
jgi:hypothetical protein